MKYTYLFSFALLCASTLFGAATSGSTPTEQYQQALQQGNINAIVTAYAELPQEMRRLPELYAPLVRALLVEKPIDEATIATLQNIFMNAQHPVLMWVLRNDRTELDQRLNQLEQEMEYYADVTASSISSADTDEFPHMEAVPQPASSMEATTSTAGNIPTAIATKPIEVPTLQELALRAIVKDITTKRPFTAPLPMTTQLPKQLPIPSSALLLGRREPITLETLQMQAKKWAENFLGVPVISTAPAQSAVTTIYSADDLRAIIASAVPHEQLEKLRGIGLDETIFKRLANIVAKDYFLKLSPKKEGRTPELLPAWLREHFTGISIQDLIDYGTDFKALARSITITGGYITGGYPRRHFATGDIQLDLSNMYINDLTGLKNIPGIENIQLLTLNQNQITTIEPGAFANLTQLITLFLDSNQITTIFASAFAGLSQLRQLSMVQNLIANITPDTFAGLPKLVILRLNNNQITTIESNTFAGLSRLQLLLLDNNQVTTIEPNTFAGLPRLHTLELSYNQITIIEPTTFTGLSRLDMLGLNYNQITTIEPNRFAGLSKLRLLQLDHNQITTIFANAFANLPKLQILNLHNNLITIIELGAFSNLPDLQYFGLYQNPIAQNLEERARIEEEVRTAANAPGRVLLYQIIEWETP